MKPVIVVALMLSASARPVEPHPLIGVWEITYPWHLEVENGVVTPTVEKGQLTVEAQGDSLIAMLSTRPSPQFPSRRPIRLAATLGNDQMVFVTRDLVTFTTPAAAREVTAVSTWVLRPDGDRLEGSLERRLEGVGVPSHGPQRLTGSRVRS